MVALSTPAGESALAVVRISGPACERLALECFTQSQPLKTRVAHLREYKSLGDKLLDKCVALFFPGESTYTGEPMLELSLHGSPLIVQLVMEDLLKRGCRMAEAGEFTRTAFLNGKLDLSQAEAVIDLIHARSERALHAAHRQLSGALGSRMQEYTNRLLRIQAEIEAYIDFPEEDLPTEDSQGPLRLLKDLRLNISQLIDTQHYASLLHEGVKAVIVGAPNAGKSSLLNALVGQDRVIVSDIPGTTRDVVTERVVVGDVVLQLMDTAGLHESDDSIEQMGMQKTLQRLEAADLYLIVLDSAEPSPTLPPEVMARFTPDNSLVIENKCDLVTSADMAAVLPELRHVRLSLKDQTGFDTLKDALVETLSSGRVVPEPDELIVSARHATALGRAVEAIDATRVLLRDEGPAELVASELRLAVEAFGEVVGKIDNEAMLDQLFANFCIGK